MTTPADLVALALRARTAMTEAQSVTLMIRGVGRICAADPAVLLHDRDGQPTFLCESGSPVTPAAERECAAVLAVVGCDEAGAMLTVTVCGRLTHLGTETRADATVDVIGLTPTTVFVEEDDPQAQHVVQHRVPVEVYTAAGPELAGRCARRVARHTTQAHQPQLRAFVAARESIPVDAVAGVSLAGLTAHGAQLQWVDADGSHQLDLVFTTPARTPPELALRLRAALES